MSCPVIIWDMLLPDVTHVILSLQIWIKVGRLRTKQLVPFFRSTRYRMDRACGRHPWCFQRRWLLFWFRPPVSAPSLWRPAASLVLRPTMLSGEWVIRPWDGGRLHSLAPCEHVPAKQTLELTLKLKALINHLELHSSFPYTTDQTFGISYAHQQCIYLIKNTVKTVILWNIITF